MSKSKKILFVSIAWPENGSGNLYKDLMDEFRDHGHQVFVVCNDEKKNHNDQVFNEDGMHVLRVKTAPIRKVNKLKKAHSLSTLGTKFKRQIKRHFNDVRFDLIITHTPTITLSGLMNYLKQKNQALFYLLLKDMWPHDQASLGTIRRKGLIWHYFRWHEKRIYRYADYIGCMSPGNVRYLLEHNHGIDPGKVEENPNTIHPRGIGYNNSELVRSKYNIPVHTTVFIFSGNLSKGHNLEFLIASINALRAYQHAYFVVGGSGLYFNYLNQRILDLKLPNIFLYHYLPAEEFKQILSACDVGLVLLDSRYETPEFPSRLLAYLDAAKPVLCSINQATDIGDIIEKAGCGISTLNGDFQGFIDAIKYLAENRHIRSLMGERARKLLHQRYLAKFSYDTIHKHLTNRQSIGHPTMLNCKF